MRYFCVLPCVFKRMCHADTLVSQSRINLNTGRGYSVDYNG